MAVKTKVKLTISLDMYGDHSDIDVSNIGRFIELRRGTIMTVVSIDQPEVTYTKPVADQKVRELNVMKKVLKSIVGDTFKLKKWYDSKSDTYVNAVYSPKDCHPAPAISSWKNHIGPQTVIRFVICLPEIKIDVVYNSDGIAVLSNKNDMILNINDPSFHQQAIDHINKHGWNIGAK